MKPIMLILAATTALTFAPAAQAQNVIVNGGFESGAISPWFVDRNFGGTSPWSVTTADKHSGTYSAIDIGNIELRQNFAGVATSSVAAASFWIKHPNLTTAPAFVSFFYSDSTNTGFTVNTSSADWEQFNILSNLAAGKTLTGFSIFGYVGGNGDPTTYLDDVQIVVRDNGVPEPATWMMMIMGFGMVGGALRQRRVTVRYV
ncbi:MAG: PEPxxWA-CTERM sorting domain-containing protein [Sphingomonas sp.]